MNITPHEFRDAFAAGRCTGFAITLDPKDEAGVRPFLRQKLNNYHLCLFVFQSLDAARHERENMPPTFPIDVVETTLEEITQFVAKVDPVSTLVYLRDDAGNFAPL